MNDWFMDLVRERMELLGLKNSKQLAEHVGKPAPTVWRWLKGIQAPAYKDLTEVAEKLGINLPTTTVNETPNEYRTKADELKIFGTVAAGVAKVAEQELRVLTSPREAWKSSAYWSLIHGEVIYLEVDGPSMEPEYPDGCLLACAKPADPSAIKDFTPVIARIDTDVTFKLFRRSTDRAGRPEVELVPLNRLFDVQRYAPRDVHIDFIVLGFLNSWKFGVNLQPRGMILRES